MNKIKIIKQKTKNPCYCCTESLHGKTKKRIKCKTCNGTGFYIETHYIIITIDKKGHQYAIDGDTIK